MKEYIQRLSPYWKPHRKSLAIAVFCTIISGALMGVFYWLFKGVLAAILSSDTPTTSTQLNLFMLGVFVWAMARAAADFGREYFIQRVWQRILATLRMQLFTHFQNLSVGFLKSGAPAN